MKLPIPVNIILGPYGAGKTSFINVLLQNKDPGEKWAVIVNEKGEVALDDSKSSSGPIIGGTSSSGSGSDQVAVREIGGGCVCCTLAGVLSSSIAQVNNRSCVANECRGCLAAQLPWVGGMQL